MARKTHQDYVKEVAAVCKTVKVLGEYINYNTKILHKCTVCKNTWLVTPNNVLYGQHCPTCAIAARNKSKTRTPAAYLKELKAIHGKSVVAKEDYIKGTTKILHLCTLCDTQWQASPEKLLAGHGCPKCNGISLAQRRKYHVQRLKAFHGSRIKLLEYNWPPRKFKSKYQCSYNHVFETSSDTVEKHNCPICSHASRPFVSSFKSVRIGKKLFKIQGYEEHAINWLLSNTPIKAADIEVYSGGKVPYISWEEGGRTKYHFPDIFIPKLNLLCEVKSKATVGLSGFIRLTPAEMFASVKKKANKALEAGFDYRLFVMDENGDRLKLPKNWYELSFREFKSSMS